MSVDVRFAASIALKNNIAVVGANQYVKEEIVKMIADSNYVMRKSCGMIFDASFFLKFFCYLDIWIIVLIILSFFFHISLLYSSLIIDSYCNYRNIEKERLS